jgi:hypothetical protein
VPVTTVTGPCSAAWLQASRNARLRLPTTSEVGAAAVSGPAKGSHGSDDGPSSEWRSRCRLAATVPVKFCSDQSCSAVQPITITSMNPPHGLMMQTVPHTRPTSRLAAALPISKCFKLTMRGERHVTCQLSDGSVLLVC